MFRLRAFGGLTLERDGAPYAGPATQRRRLALLALLASADTPVSRDRLMGYLWPDSGPERARHSLDDALSALRRELGSDDLFLGVASVGLNRDVLASDLGDHATALRAGDAERAVTLYAGPFLDGFFVPDAGEFERWVDAERSRRLHAHMRLLETLAADAAARGDVVAAIRWHQARVAANPLDTPATLRLLAALASAGNPGEALRVARVHETLMREELESTPGPEWATAVEDLRAQLARPPDRPAPVATSEPPTPPADAMQRVADNGNGSRSSAVATPVAWLAADRRWPVRLIAGVALLLLAGLGVRAAWQGRLTTTHSTTPTLEAGGLVSRSSLAVLPCANISGEPADEPFSDGLTEELIGALSKAQGLRVTGRTSAFALKGRGLDVRTIADTLGVGTVLECSVRRVGNRLRISAQLVSAGDNGVVWADTYDRQLEDVFAVQTDIARAITGALRPTMSAPAEAVGRVRTRDLATYELYLKGRYFSGRRTPGDLRRAVGYFEQAVARDSTYAQAFAGLADARVLLVLLADSPPAEELPRARVAAAEAIRLDSTLAEAHAAVGNIREAFDWDARGADRELARAVALDPGYATAHLYQGIHLLNRGMFEQAVAQLTQARTLDPLSAPVHMQLGRAYISARRPDQAIRSLRSAVELNPLFAAAYVQLGDAYLQQGDPVSALGAFSRAAALNGGRDSAQIAYVLAVTGHRDEAKRVLGALLAAPSRAYLPPIPVAKAYVGLGDVDAAFLWLERGYDEHAAQMRSVHVTPAFDALHADRRWALLMRRLGFEP